MGRSFVGVSVACWAVLMPASAVAGELERFEPEAELQLLGIGGVDLATGWVPAGGAIQVSFDVHVGDTVQAQMLGEAEYDADAHTLLVRGDRGGGLFSIDVGATLDARVRFDLLGNQYESEIIGPYDVLADGGALFDPFLLPGNPTRPAVIDVQTERNEVYTYSLVDVLIASGELAVDAAFDVRTELRCASVEAAPLGGAPTFIVAEQTPTTVATPSTAELELDATLRCSTTSTVTLLLYPSVKVTLGLQEFELSPFELPVVVLSDDEAPLDFDPEPLTFDGPVPPDSSSGGADDATSMAPGLDSTGAGSDDDVPWSSSSGGGDETGGSSGGALEATGCGCVAGTGAPAYWWVLGLFLGARRRRCRS